MLTESFGALISWPTSVKGKHHTCTIGMCPPLQGDAEVMKAVMFLNAT